VLDDDVAVEFLDVDCVSTAEEEPHRFHESATGSSVLSFQEVDDFGVAPFNVWTSDSPRSRDSVRFQTKAGLVERPGRAKHSQGDRQFTDGGRSAIFKMPELSTSSQIISA